MKKPIALCLIAVLLISLVGCGKPLPKERPKDFEFSIRWGCYGISSYNSGTGELIKTTDATKPSDYITVLKLTDDEYDRVWELISELSLDRYPDAPEHYDPGNGYSMPSETIQLYVSYGDNEKNILAENISLNHSTNSILGNKFLKVCDEIANMLMESEEWKALPDYEFYYD